MQTVFEYGSHSGSRQTVGPAINLERTIPQQYSYTAASSLLAPHPQSSQVILYHRDDGSAEPAIGGRVAGEVATNQPADAHGGANPKPLLRGGNQESDVIAGELLSGARLPMEEAHAIETDQSLAGAQPEISVGALRDGLYGGYVDTFLLRPTGAEVLRNGQRRVEREECLSGDDKQRDDGD
jgi:hypothetical protein